ncbi:hypothetical protein [Mariniphaga sediminis]|uniref:hypothetical protein n=1 Tax=Mariniphaga sediminis TaxID=1628158 RepID=UPI0011C4558C|nr:hypothetical protein [Mariniphaga sediminis]
MINRSFIKTGLFLFIIGLVFFGYITFCIPLRQGTAKLRELQGQKRVKTAKGREVKRTQILHGMERDG